MKTFPKLPGPHPVVWGLGMLAVLMTGIFMWPQREVFLALNLAACGAVLAVIIRGHGVLQKGDTSFLLASNLFLILALYGLYRSFGQIDAWMIYGYSALPALLFFLGLKVYAFRYAWQQAIAIADTLEIDNMFDFAEQCRTKFRGEIAALAVAAEVFRTVAEDALKRGSRLRPVHIIAMHKYSHMLLYGEAKGNMGEGEWFAKKADELSKLLLKAEKGPGTIH